MMQHSSHQAGDPFAKPEGQMQASSNPAGQQRIEAHNIAGSNFYTIAVFSLINSIISFFQGGIYFPIGLGVTQIIDGFSYAFQQEIPEAGTLFLVIGLVLNLLIFAIVGFFGYFIKKQVTWLIPAGGVLYLLDGLLLLVFEDWLGAAFHAYFLFRLWSSWQVIRSIPKPVVPESAIGSI
jgi:hypothetical protein